MEADGFLTSHHSMKEHMVNTEVEGVTCSLHFANAAFSEAENTPGSIGTTISIITPPCLSFTKGSCSTGTVNSAATVEFVEPDIALRTSSPLRLLPAPAKG